MLRTTTWMGKLRECRKLRKEAMMASLLGRRA